MTVICDACPLIFLAKLNKLDLIQRLFSGDIIILSIIKEEILAQSIPAAEEAALLFFLETCKIIDQSERDFSSTTLSNADNYLLTYAIKEGADILISDDKLVRRTAAAAAIRSVGTLGILLRAMSRSILTPKCTRELINELIHTHHFRISIEVFESVLRIIE